MSLVLQLPMFTTKELHLALSALLSSALHLCTIFSLVGCSLQCWAATKAAEPKKLFFNVSAFALPLLHGRSVSAAFI